MGFRLRRSLTRGSKGFTAWGSNPFFPPSTITNLRPWFPTISSSGQKQQMPQPKGNRIQSERPAGSPPVVKKNSHFRI
jgi:hypothetical protein